jgi:hypothetical protein
VKISSPRIVKFLMFPLLCFFLVPMPLSAVDVYDEIEGSGLFIDSVPGTAKVYVDGVERGLTPLYLSLQAGEYSIRLNKDGYVDRRINVTVRRGSRIELSLDLEEAKGQLLLEIVQPRPASGEDLPLESRPAEPAVYVDGVQVYQRSLSLPIGWRTISIEAFGWEKWSQPVFIEQDRVLRLEAVLKQAPFRMTNPRLRRGRFNPANSGALGKAEALFEVSAPGNGTLEVYNPEGHRVYESPLGPFVGWLQEFSWNGRDSQGRILPDGNYTLRITVWAASVPAAAEPRIETKAELTAELDSSLEIRPLSIPAAEGGLLFGPSPEVLPKGSYQVSGLVLLGKPLEEASYLDSLPLALAFRFSPLDRLEFAAALNVNPRFSGTTLWGGGASAKWLLIPGQGRDSKGPDFKVAASLSYGYFRDTLNTGYQTPFGMGKGLNLSLPLSLRFTPSKGTAGEKPEKPPDSSPLNLDLLFTPRLLWAGTRGYPDSFIPRPGAAAGLLFQYGPAGGGLSLQWDFDTRKKASGPLVSTLEFSYLTRTNIILFASAGGWLGQENGVWRQGAFFGLGLGFMY